VLAGAESLLNEEIGVVTKGLSVQSMQESVSRPIRNGSTTICLSSLAVLEGLSAKGTLIDFALVRAGEGDAKVFEFDDCAGSLAAHVMDCVLIAEPV
jgi:hypothetical protein